jgi:2-polyprenyl-3-methyl-5-hydroxy-6-metoxy-1,4-benzoquinol methylase
MAQASARKDYDAFADAAAAFEEAVHAQERPSASEFDEDYFAKDWRAGENRYDLETRRKIEGRNPRLIAETFAPKRVLDVGCGPGFLMLLLQELGIEVFGIDLSPTSRELAPPEVRDRIVIGDMTEPLVEEHAFDVVVCREVLEHATVLQVARTVEQLCRATSRYVYVTTRFHPRPRTLLDFTTDFATDPTHVTLLAKDFLRALFVLQGMRSRPDLEAQLDWLHKGRVLVYERSSNT